LPSMVEGFCRSRFSPQVVSTASRNWFRPPGRFTHCRNDLVGIRPRPLGEFGDQASLAGGHHPAADQDVELSPATLDHLDGCLQGLTKQGGVTRRLLGDGGSGFAIDDLDIHRGVLSSLGYLARSSGYSLQADVLYVIRGQYPVNGSDLPVVSEFHEASLCFRDAEDLLAERGIVVTHETIRQWSGKQTQPASKRIPPKFKQNQLLTTIVKGVRPTHGGRHSLWPWPEVTPRFSDVAP